MASPIDNGNRRGMETGVGSAPSEKSSQRGLTSGRDRFGHHFNQGSQQSLDHRDEDKFKALLQKKQMADEINANELANLSTAQVNLFDPLRSNDVGQFPETKNEVSTTTTIEKIRDLVTSFNLRDPLLATTPVSCLIEFSDNFSVETSLKYNKLGEIEIYIATTAREFGQRTRNNQEALQAALMAKFPSRRFCLLFEADPDVLNDAERA